MSGPVASLLSEAVPSAAALWLGNGPSFGPGSVSVDTTHSRCPGLAAVLMYLLRACVRSWRHRATYYDDREDYGVGAMEVEFDLGPNAAVGEARRCRGPGSAVTAVVARPGPFDRPQSSLFSCMSATSNHSTLPNGSATGSRASVVLRR